MGGRGRDSEPIEWTGWAAHLKDEIEANPDFMSLTGGTSPRKRAEVTGPQAAQKSL